MLMMKEKAGNGKLKGIQPPNDEQLTHYILANNIGLFFTREEGNFNCATEVIKSSERIFGASLNLRKSMVIPLFLNRPMPRWLLDARYKIIGRREVITYQGYPVGHEIIVFMEAKFLLGKVQKRFNNWANIFLS